ncbi:hypothetical protein Pst134EA_003188 [Puccinia striiformis f. sp. tritici]|uniref:Uncharacterized protein n=1 Tax=Puccinia striiformis TaxID=27350 RepID=A0A2S4V6J7_9BASI|nr:uncharacterized protein Pst134EA_031463 [Puccinia striiformis f. sp. tritici]XP_047812035.1 hypothetical protein Pst134EA_003188 [Puccinia striiformis f. sp. tritici]KAH9445287.1 hypothetical protein Pst134EA_031463 [Puccinia striiformis f. sp. tritici]KAH9472581.1 hypothetical protein Pst134EA_003188 [Puccinia striiformis f. sp. tritici]POW05153.1 hypothetical protein PSTT_09907 [Puccinia striiformis]
MLDLAAIAFIKPSTATQVNQLPEANRKLRIRSTLNYSGNTSPDLPVYDVTVDVCERDLPCDGGWLFDINHRFLGDVQSWSTQPTSSRPQSLIAESGHDVPSSL